MEENQLVALSKTFAVDIINLCDTMKIQGKASAIINQLLRSGTSIGANIHEANYASSKADFINKFQIALKECYETESPSRNISERCQKGCTGETENRYQASN